MTLPIDILVVVGCSCIDIRVESSPLAIKKTFDGVKFVAEDSSWLMLRGSGTEPILRIYAEAKSDANAQELLHLGVKLTQNKIFR